MDQTQAQAQGQQQAQKLQSCNCPCDPADCQKMAAANFNFTNLIALAEKDGQLVAALIKDIVAALGVA